MNDDRTKRVLIIDDATLIRSYYRQALERHGYVVDEALNGLEGLEKLLVQEADLVILDVNMPQMDGVTFLKTLRAHDSQISAIPVLVTSTEAGREDAAAAQAAGANFYLVKPVEQETLALYVGMLSGADHE